MIESPAADILARLEACGAYERERGVVRSANGDSGHHEKMKLTTSSAE